jgi:hypothetical protein
MPDEDMMSETPQPAPYQLRVLTNLVVEMSRLELRELELERELEAVKKELGGYKRKIVPDCMTEIGVDSLRLAGSGAEVRVETVVSCELAKDPLERSVAMKFLRDSGNDEIVTRQVKIVFDRDSTKQADALMDLLAASRILLGDAEVSYEWTVHHSTLGKFVRETLAREKTQREEGEEPETPLPRKAFGVYERREASIHRKRTK